MRSQPQSDLEKRAQYSIKECHLTLPEHAPVLGMARHPSVDENYSVKDAIMMAFPPGMVDEFLVCMEAERESRHRQRSERLARRLSSPTRRVTVEQTVATTSKRTVSIVGGSTPKRRVSIRARTSPRNVSRSSKSVRSSQSTPFTREGFLAFLAILFFLGTHKTTNIHDLWVSNEEMGFPIIKRIMARTRFDEYYRSLIMAEPMLCDLEHAFRNHVQSIWVHSNVVVVDETVVSYQGMDNPHHVFIPRKPHPHGLKVSD